MKVLINSEQMPISKGSLSINSAIGERSTCSFTIVDIDGVMSFDRGMNVRVEHENGKVEFGGIIENSVEVRIAGIGLFHQINCIDWHYLADKRIVAKRYENTSTGNIIIDLVNSYLKQEGVLTSLTSKYIASLSPTFNLTNNAYFTLGNNEIKLKPASPKSITRKEIFFYEQYYVNQGTQKYPAVLSEKESMGGYNGRLDYFNKSINEKNAGATTYTSPSGGRWVILDLGSNERAMPKSYIIGNGKTGENALSVTSWTLEGYIAETDKWEMLDQKTNYTWKFKQETGFAEVVEFPINPNKKIYQKFRLTYPQYQQTSKNYLGSGIIINPYETFAYNTTRTIVSNPIDLTSITDFSGAGLSWVESLPKQTQIVIETSIDGGQWNYASNGFSVSGLNKNSKSLRIRLTMLTKNENETPSIKNIRLRFYSGDVNIGDGSLLEECVLNYIPISEAIDSLADKSGYWWDISPTKELRFGERYLKVAPFGINTNNIIKDSLSVENGNIHYRNKQYVIGGKDLSDVQTEKFKGDGVQQTFNVAYKIAKKPNIYLDEVLQRVGIRGLDDGDDTAHNFDWFWSKGDTAITQNKDHTPIESSNILKSEYQGEFAIVVVTKDNNAINSNAKNEGTTGIVENVLEDKGLQSRNSALQTATSKIKQYCQFGKKIKFKTWETGLEIGQLINVTFPLHRLDRTEFLIETIEVTCEDDYLEYNITASHNVSEGSWAKFFYELATKGRTFVVKENINDGEYLSLLEQFEKIWTESEEPNPFAELYPSETLFPSEELFPVFGVKNAVRYCALYNGNTEIVRRQITQLTINPSETEINSTVVFMPNEAVNRLITNVAWFGGSASDEPYSGTLLESQLYTLYKTKETTIQIDRQDVKGW